MTVDARRDELTGVWAELIGQHRAVKVLRRAVASSRQQAEAGRHAMTHAWLVTGPPGSGRSNAARAFAAALQCERGGCGECNGCRTVLSGAHPDVTLVRTEKLSIGVDEVRELVRKAAMSPTLGRHQVLVVEDADRVTERGADALLKSIEEPAARTVWILCAPTMDDVVVTIRSRCRHLHLVTPSDDAVAQLLQRRDGIDAPLAAHAARAAQGHIGRARVLARDEQARIRRDEVLRIPARLTSIGACLVAADNVVKAAADEAAAATQLLDTRERADLDQALGFGTKGARPRNTQAVLKELEDQQKARAKRLQRDALDRVLTELTAYYRDVLGVQTGALVDPMGQEPGVGMINADLREQVATLARSSTPEQTLQRIDAIMQCRVDLEGNVAPLLAVEALMVALAQRH
ncbi:DNA polymerase III subunit delta' [Aestuariimicrobium ganziense]|uniref:DNA polymerase III subunit delta' n=1 Tax=Aestuariimicrobium ganziense TaxID=2773677 RepID=UPI001944FC33|nr:DNA polymerase III subunit delta' [Aestuariimicrobium ganziense]